MLHGRPSGKPDDLGTVIRDADHHAQFHFRLADFKRDGVLDELALAARCTASFPGAFEPCFVPIRTEPSSAHLEMERVASFAESRWVIDGGVLLNKPIKPALKAIFGMLADTQVRRVMLYVVPQAAPEPPLKDQPEPAPPFAQTLLAGSTTIPASQSVSAELEAILEHNERVDATRQRRALAARLGGGHVESLAAEIYMDYRAVVAKVIAGWIMRLVTSGGNTRRVGA